MKNTKKALLTSVLALVLCFSMLIGTTFAWFTDTTSTGVNTIISGKLDVVLEYWDGKEWVDAQGKTLDFIDLDGNTLWEPGCTYELPKLRVRNAGNLALKYQFVISGLTGDAELLKVIDWTVNDQPMEVTYTGTLAPGAISEGLILKGHMQETAGNDYMDKKIENISISVYATQLNSESDSYGPDYDEDAWHPAMKVYSAQDLQAAINNGETNIELMDDIKLTDTIVIPAPVDRRSAAVEPTRIVIDLNGKTLTGAMHKNEGAVINNKGYLKLINGTVSSTANNGGSAIMNSGNAILEEVTLNGAPNADGSWPSYTVNNTGVMTVTDTKITSYHGAVSSYGEGALVTLNNSEIDMTGIPGFTSHGIYTYNNGAVEVNGGKYANKATDQGNSGASVINGAVTINGGTFSGRIENYYGTPVIKGGTFSVKPNAKFIAAGYKVNQVNDVYVITDEKTDMVSNADELVAALEKGQNVIFANDIKIEPASMSNAYGATGINVKYGQTIDGNGYTLNVKGAGGTWDSGINTTGGLIKNITITGSFRGIFINHNSDHSEKVVLENVVIGGNGTVYTISCDQGLNQGIEATNCTFNGWTSFAKTAGEAKFVNCSFGEGSGYKYCRPYSNTEFVNCTFSEGYTVDTTRAIVIIDGKTAAADTAGVNNALNNGEDVVLMDDVKVLATEVGSNGYGATGVKVSGSTLDGNGNSLGVDAWGTWDSAINITGGTIKNLTVNCGMRGIFMGSATADVYIDNVIIDGTIYTFNSDGGSKEYGVYISNSTLNGWTSHSDVHKEVVYTNCEFGEGQGYAFCRPYGPTKFVGCNFSEGYTVDPVGAVVFENCTINGVALTAENVADLVTNIENATVK